MKLSCPTYSAEKKDDGHDTANVVPELIDPVSDQSVNTGNSTEPVAITVPMPPICDGVDTLLPVPEPVCVPLPDSIVSSTHSSPHPSNTVARREVISTPPPPNVDPSVNFVAGDVPMEIDDDVGLVMPMEVDNHASLDGTPPSQSSLDTLDLSKVPVWLQAPLKHLRKEFSGELEDRVLGAFVGLEMAWQPVSAHAFNIYFLQLMLISYSSKNV